MTLELADLFFAVDQPIAEMQQPETWTRGGRPLTLAEVAIVRQANADDWQILHDLSVLDGATCSHHQHEASPRRDVLAQLDHDLDLWKSDR